MQLLAATLCAAGKQNPMENTKFNVHMPIHHALPIYIGIHNCGQAGRFTGMEIGKKIMGAGHKIKGSISSCHPFLLHINPGSPISQLDSHMRDLCILSR